MFRKRIAQAGIIAISTFAASVVAPQIASAQVIDLDEEDGGGDVIDLDEAGSKGGGGQAKGKKVIDLDEEGGGGVAAVAGEPTDASG